MRTLLATTSCLLWAMLCSLALAPAANAQLSYTVPAADVAAQLQQTLGGTTLHLHSLGPLANGSYYAANASSIKIPASVSGMPGQRTYFSLPDESRVFLNSRYGYYVDHVRSNGLFVAAGADTFTISITLASAGPALIGTCVRTRAPGGPCGALTGAILPPIEWRDGRVDIIVKPVVANGGVALDVVDVVIGGTFDLGKTCEWPVIGTRLCAAVNKQSERLRTRVAAAAKTLLNGDVVRRQVAAGVRQYLDTTLNEPLLTVRRIAMQDGTLTVGLGVSFSSRR